MRCVDVTVLVYAHRSESPNHRAHRAWFEDALNDSEPLAVPPIVASGFLRIVTHPKIFRDPTPLESALSFVDTMRGAPAFRSIAPGERHWSIFTDLCHRLGATGNRIPDAFLAALAIEHNATWISADRGFAGYPGLRWQHPLDPV